MEADLVYTCPSCSNECSVAVSLVGLNLTCPSCSAEFFATPPDEPPPDNGGSSPRGPASLPSKLPFFKSGRKKLLAAKLAELVEDGELDKNDERELFHLAAQLDLDKGDLESLQKEKFLGEFSVIKRRIETNFMLTDDDLLEMKSLEKKYDIQLSLTGDNQLFRSVYLIEVKGELPAPIHSGLMLDSSEEAYFSITTTWYQTRVRTHGYAGPSVSVPTGIKGVRFRFGGFVPIRTEQITPLADGVLYVTSKRLLFNGNSRNTNITYKRIVDCNIYSDSLAVEKSTGKPDLFGMSPAAARYITALVGALR